MQTMTQAMQSQLDITNPVHKTLASYSRKKLEVYMVDCHGFDTDQLIEWETVEDLACDIRSFGWERDCLEYLA